MEDIHSNLFIFMRIFLHLLNIYSRIHSTSTNFFNQREMKIGEEITAEEEQMLQRLQRKKQKIESRKASMI